jgi:hypothetical protein
MPYSSIATARQAAAKRLRRPQSRVKGEPPTSAISRPRFLVKGIVHSQGSIHSAHKNTRATSRGDPVHKLSPFNMYICSR